MMKRPMRNPLLLFVAVGLAAPVALRAQTSQGAGFNTDPKEWPVERGGRSRDPYVAPDGKVWFAGQAGNYIGLLDPATGGVRYYEIDEGTHPHTVIVDDQGDVWYAGNRNAHIGRLNPATGEITKFPTGDARDPHTMHFDGKGNIWFTSQGSSRIGRLNMATGKVDLVNPIDRRANPYGIDLDPQGVPFASLFATNMVARVDPVTLEVRTYLTADSGRVRRNTVTSDGMVWYVDYRRGYLGRLDPKTGQTTEWRSPGGPESRPYAITADDQDRIWISETGEVKQLAGFDPEGGRFFTVFPVSHNVRNMMFDPRTGMMWFGTDANMIGRFQTRPLIP